MDDIHQLDGPRFFRLAWRISAYEGVLHMRLQEQQARAEAPTEASPRPVNPRRAPVPKGAEVVPFAAFALKFPGMVEHGKAQTGG